MYIVLADFVVASLIGKTVTSIKMIGGLDLASVGKCKGTVIDLTHNVPTR